jgi:CheY-like chemotaxis protein
MLSQFWGHEVQTAHDGLSAIRETHAFQPELVLLDIGLPGLDGYEVARRLREDPATKDLVLVALTGYGQEEDRRRSHAAGFNEHLVKPASVDALQAVFLRAEKLVESSAPEETATGSRAAV